MGPKYLTFVVGMIAVLSGLLLQDEFITDVDVCFADPSSNSYQKLVSNGIFYVSILALMFCFSQVALWPPSNPQEDGTIINWNHAFYLTFSLLWFSATHCLVRLLKMSLGDSLCSRRQKNNSISGHFNFHLFYFLILFYLGGMLLKSETRKKKNDDNNNNNNNNNNTTTTTTTTTTTPNANLSWRLKQFWISFGVFTVSSSITLTRTFFGGYHTARQIVYGSILGIVSATIAFFILDQIHEKSVELTTPTTNLTAGGQENKIRAARRFTRYSIMLLCVYFSFGMLSTYLVGIRPFSHWEEVFLGVLFHVLFSAQHGVF